MALTRITSKSISELAASEVTSGTFADARISASSVNQHATDYDDNKVQSNIAILAFKTATNGSLATYNLVDQVIDEYTDATGIDASASTNEILTDGVVRGATGTNPTGGTTGSYSHGGTTYYFNKFTTDANFVTSTGGTGDIFLIAGGGGSNWDNGGGGGAGGLIWKPNHSFAGSTTFAVDIGDGGTGRSSSADPTTGQDTTFASTTFVAKGGGYGGRHNQAGSQLDGGSGGGAGRNYSPGGPPGSATQPSQSGDSGTYGFGNAGGAGRAASDGPAGGGGGAGTAGSAGVSGTRGAGGDGHSSFVNSSTAETTAFLLGTTSGTDASNVATTGSSSGTLYIGGGGGGSTQNSGGWATAAGGEGGKGGGADSPDGHTATTGGNGLPNTGGGGGSANQQTSGGNGGSGLLIVRYTASGFVSAGDLTLQSTDTTAQAVPTKADMVTLVENVAGTATLNTDIKGWISRDSGANFTQGTLVDEGTWGTNKKVLAFHDLDISGQPSGTSMCYKITTHNQSGAKDTRIHATSIGWK